MKGVVLGDGGGEAAIESHRYRLPHHLHEADAALVASPFLDQDHRLPGHLLQKESVSKLCLYQLHYQLPL